MLQAAAAAEPAWQAPARSPPRGNRGDCMQGRPPTRGLREPSRQARPTTHLPWYRLAAVTLFSLALGVVSNTLEPAVLGHKVLELVPDQKNTALGFTTFAGLIVAVAWQPILGAWSDRTRSPLGRRAPYV